MTSEKQIMIYEELFRNILETTKKKRADYSGNREVLSNFRSVAEAAKALKIDVTKPDQYALFMVILKIARITNLINNNKIPQNEGVEDSYLDAINYFILSYCCYKEEHPSIPAIDESSSLPATYDNEEGTIKEKTVFEITD